MWEVSPEEDGDTYHLLFISLFYPLNLWIVNISRMIQDP